MPPYSNEHMRLSILSQATTPTSCVAAGASSRGEEATTDMASQMSGVSRILRCLVGVMLATDEGELGEGGVAATGASAADMVVH